MAVMNYKQTNRYPDGTGMLLDTTPGTPDSGSYTTEAQLKQWTNAEIISGSQVVGKAQKDQNGNVIDTTYATKAELNAEIATREAIDQNLDTRLTNVETALTGTVIQEHVDSTQANVKTILSADTLLPWAIMKRVGARATQFNQLVENGDFSDGTSGWYYYSYATIISVSDGICTLTSSSSGFSLYRTIPTVPAGHVVLVSYEARSNDTTYNLAISFGTIMIPSESLSSTFKQISVLVTSSSDQSSIELIRYSNISGHKIDVRNVMIIDLTTMSEYDSGKTDAQNIASFRAKFPASYYPQTNGSLIDLPPLSFLYRGTNQWDEDFLPHYQWTTSGSKVSAENWNCSNNMYKCLPSTQYYFMINNKATFNVAIFWYDANGNYVDDNGLFSAGYRTSPANASYFALNIAISEYGGTTYNHDIMICLNSVTDKTYKSYIGQTIDTSFMAGTRYVNPSCYDYAENVYVNGILKRKNQTVVGSVDLGTLNWRMDTSYSSPLFVCDDFDVAKGESANNVPANCICAMYKTESSNDVIANDMNINIQNNYIYSGTCIIVHNETYSDASSFKTAMDGVYMYYELATLPDPTYGDPIPNFPCEDGSTITAITPQTDIVNAIDVPSTIAYGTKISA